MSIELQSAITAPTPGSALARLAAIVLIAGTVASVVLGHMVVWFSVGVWLSRA